MALTSRLELEVDSGGAEQQVNNIRKALTELEAQGLRSSSALSKTSSEFGNLALSLTRAQAANDKASSSSDKAAKSIEDAARAAVSQRKELDALLGSINPLTKQLNQLAAQEAALVKARDSGQINLAAYDAYNKKLQENLNALTGATKAQQAMGEGAEQAQARLLAVGAAAVDAAQAQRNLSNSATGLSEAQQGLLTSTAGVSTAQARVVTSSDKVSAAMKQAGVSSRAQSDSLQDLLEQIDPTTKALNRLDDQERRLAQQKKLGMDHDTFIKYQATIDKTREALTRFDDGLTHTGNSAKQNSAALRMLPAQFSDIFTSLQGGQAPLTVLLQQGSQIKDSFGGIGAASKALGGYIAGLINPFTVAAAAVGTLGLAYYQGSKEADAYSQALILSGNAAGTSSGAISSMAANVSRSVGTIGAASVVLAQLASSSAIPASSFEMIATAALKMENATGKAASQTVADFEKLAKDPAKYSKELNDQLGYMTAATYAQIEALVQQGDRQAAANLAEKTYADAVSDRADLIKSKLGLVESAWDGVKGAAKGAWDAVLDIGREDTFEQKLIKLEDRLQRIRNAKIAPVMFDDNPNLGELGAGEDGAQAAITDAYVQKAEDERRIAARAEILRLDKESIASQEKLNEALKNTASNEEKRLARHKEIEAQVESARSRGKAYSEAEIKQLKDAADEQYKTIEKKAAATKAYTEDAGTKMLDQARQQYAVLQQQGLLIDNQATGTKALGTEAKKLTELEQQIADIKTKQTLTADQKSILTMADLNIAQQKRNAGLEKENALRKIATEESQKLLTFTQSVNDKLAQQQQGLDSNLYGIGMGTEGRKRLQDDLKIQQDYQNDVQALQRDFQNGKITQDLYDKETDVLEEALAKRMVAQQVYYQDVGRLQSDWTIGASTALNNYFEESSNIAKQTEGLVSNGLHELEDAFVDVFTTGKFSFKDLADSIIADLARMLAKAYVVMPILGALGLSGSSAGEGGISGAWSSITGGSSGGGGITSMISSAKTVIDVASSKFGESLVNGWNSGGDSIVDSITGAFDGGSSYVSDAISSAFTAGSATASVAAEATAATFSAGITESAAAIGSQFSAEIGGAALSYEAASSASANALSTTLGTLSTALSVIGTAYTVFTAFQDYGIEGGLTTAGFAAAGAAIGSVVPIIGTAVGAAIGAVIGSIASSSWFGGPNYEQLVSSAEGSYSKGQFTNGGWVDGWKENKTRLGSGADSQLSSYVQQFTSTLGMLYDALGDDSDVSAQMTMRRRETSGDYSNYFTATLDSGEMISGLQQYGLDVAENLTTYYDDMMGTFLAQAIVKSTSLPDYFKAQFQEFSTDWDVTADTVIAAIESVFTRFNGVNSALGQINVANLKLNETGMIASDSILNMVASLAKLDTATATAQEKVDALNQLVNGYYSVFFTADEQFADLTKSLESSFAGFGLDLPDTRPAYRDMVEDIDVTTAAGQAMFATMMGLATAADSYYTEIDKQAQAAVDAAQAAAQAISDALSLGVTNSFSAVQRAIAAQQKATTEAYNATTTSLNDMLSTASGNVSGLTSVGNDLSAALKALRGDSDDAVKMLRAQAQATLQSALATARSGGSLSGFTGLEDALDTVSSNNTDLYGSMEDFARDQGRTANVVAELNAINGKQLTAAEKLQQSLEEQIKLAEDNYKLLIDQFESEQAFAQAQLDALNGVDTSIMTVAAAVNAMNAAVVAALSTLPRTGAGSAVANTPQNNATHVETIYQSVLGRDTKGDEAGAAFWAAQLQSGAMGYDQIAAAIAQGAFGNGAESAATKAKAGKYLGLPGHATGGLISGPGTGTSDSILARLSNGEYVMRASAVKTYGTDLLDKMNSGIRLVGTAGAGAETTSSTHYGSSSKSAALTAAGSSSSSSEMAERQAWTNKLLNQLINAVNRQTTQGVPALPVK